MQAYQIVHCPNCGGLAERHHCQEQRLTRLQCSLCDYLLVTCTQSGRVIEAYAPGLYTYQVRSESTPLALGGTQLAASR